MSDAPYAMTAREIGELLEITPRRVTQYRDAGLLPTIERGKFDMAFLMYLRHGELITRKAGVRANRDALVARGWLVGHPDELSPDDLTAFAGLFERNGLTRDAALLALGRAQSMVKR